jgi:uncharacterized protein (TIGR03437 family)
MSRLLALLPLVLAPAALFAESSMPSLGYTGAPADHNRQNCSSCHTGSPVNSSNGSVTVNISDYNPSIQQMIRIIVQDSHATTWGFQITIRQVSDETQSAGTFLMSANIQVACDDGSRFGSAPPCSTPKQFAEQNGAPNIASGFVFEVPWVPPQPEVGRLNVYVAAVAGNGDGTAAGDHVYTFTSTIANIGGCSFSRRPVLQTALNGGSFQLPFSSNAMVSIYGTGFQTSGYNRTARLGDFVNGGFPSALGCVSVQATGPGISQPVLLPIVYVDPIQINVQMPRFSGTGPVTLQVILNPGATNQLMSDVGTFNTQLQTFAPAFFLFLPSTSIAAQFAGTANIVANPSVVPGARPARPGDIVTLYGTGFGDTNPLVAAGQLAPSGTSPLTNSITVQIGSVTLSPSDVLYAGLSPGSISGLYQFNVRIPPSTPSGDIPVTIAIGGFQTQAGATIPVQ